MTTTLTARERDALVREVRAIWTGTTGLRTYAIRWLDAIDPADLFESEMPWNDVQAHAVTRLVETTERNTGIRLVLNERKTRMTVSISRTSTTPTF